MIVILVINFILFFKLNQKTGYVADDYVYFYKYFKHYVTPNLIRVRNISDIIEGMRNHYLYCNGRLPAHFLLQLFLMVNKRVFNFANSIAFCSLAFLIYCHTNYRKKARPLLFAVIFMLMWISFRFFGVTFLWESAAVNYLWTTVFVLAFLFSYRVYAENKTTGRFGVLKLLIIIPLGILAGWTNENMGGSVVIASILFILYYRLKKRKIPGWSVSGALSSLAGFMMILLAKGNTVRLSQTKGNLNFWSRFPDTMYVIWCSSWRILPSIGLLLFLIIITCKLYGKDKKLSDMMLPMIYFITGLAGTFAMLLSPEAPVRAFTGPVIMELTAVLMALAQLLDKIDVSQCKVTYRIMATALSVLCFINIGVYTYNYRIIKIDDENYTKTIQSIYEQKKNGERNIVIEPTELKAHSYSVYYYSDNIINSSRNTKWLDKWMALYYGVDSITIKKHK